MRLVQINACIICSLKRLSYKQRHRKEKKEHNAHGAMRKVQEGGGRDHTPTIKHPTALRCIQVTSAAADACWCSRKRLVAKMEASDRTAWECTSEQASRDCCLERPKVSCSVDRVA